MRPSGRIYSKEEFEISKAILMSFLELDALKQKEYVLGVLKYEHKFLSTVSENIRNSHAPKLNFPQMKILGLNM